MTERLRFGLIGCGDFGKFLGRYIGEVAEIAALCDVSPEPMSATAAELGLDVPCYTDHATLLAAADVDAVAITAANFAHAEITVAAARAGKHVFCEKAMARTVPECWEMVRACEAAGVRLMVGHKRRLRPPWARMIELTAPSLLGAPLAITVCQYADNRPYRFWDSWWADPGLSGGYLHMHGVHVVEWFRAMCGDAASVSARWGPRHDTRYGFPDIMHATYAFHTGALASIHGALTFPLHLFRESQGPWAECEHGGFKLVPHMDHIDLIWQRADEEEAHRERFDDLGFDAAFRREVGDFVRWVQDGAEPCLTWVEGLRCVEMLEAAYRSADAGGAVVTFPLYPGLEGGE